MVEKIVSCEEVWCEISNYIDGELDTPQRSSMDGHFHTCPRCASVLAGARNVVQLYGDERMLLDVPAGFSRRLEKRLAKGTVTKEARWSSWSAWLVPAMAMALIVGAVLLTNSLTFKNYIQSRHAQPGNNVPPEMVVVVSDGSKIFHVAGSARLSTIKIPERSLTAKRSYAGGVCAVHALPTAVFEDRIDRSFRRG